VRRIFGGRAGGGQSSFPLGPAGGSRPYDVCVAEQYDYIIVGAGSAGCVLAERLSADPGKQVLLLEAGGSDRHFLVSLPKGMARLVLNPAFAWHYPVEQPRLPGAPASEVWVRGRTLGGSSSINGMIYIRGQPQDYDEWEQRGARGWNWSVMRGAFNEIETNELGAGVERGTQGPVNVSPGKFRYPVAEALIQAGEQLGLQRREDFNSGEREGVGYYAHNIRNGRRQSASTVFLKPALHRPNLRVVTGMLAERVLFRNRRAYGVVCRAGAESVTWEARGEVILSAGSIESPKLLQLSGIGPPEVLRAAGVAVLQPSPDVGRRMRDHLGFSLPHRLRSTRGLNHRFFGPGLWLSLLQYALTRGGPLATGPFEIGAFVRTHAGSTRPDAQLYMSAFSFARSNDQFPVPLADVERTPGITMYGQLLHLTSEGSVSIRTPNAGDHPSIAPNWLSTTEDQASAVALLRYMRRYMAQPALQRYVGEELSPGANCSSDEDILRAFRISSMCGTHAVSSCRMGSDPGAVVDPDTRVNGVEGLRVVDCSIMPGLVSGNTNAPAMALAWQAAKLIRRSGGPGP